MILEADEKLKNCRLIFVSMTNLLLISSLISLMSMSLEGVGFAVPTHGVRRIDAVLGIASCPRRIPFPVSSRHYE